MKIILGQLLVLSFRWQNRYLCSSLCYFSSKHQANSQKAFTWMCSANSLPFPLWPPPL